jgi:hypothetical protein
MPRQNKIVLFYPSYASNEAAPPLALIAIAGPLVSQGYDIKIIDTALETYFVVAVLRVIDGALCLCMSLISGSMIKGSVEVGTAV